MKWIEFEKEKPELGRYCLVKTIWNDQVSIEIGGYINTGTKKKPIFVWYSGCCHEIEDVKYWIYLSNFKENEMNSAIHSIALVSNNNSINLAIYHDGEWKSVIDDERLEKFLNEVTKETKNPDGFKLEYRY